MGIHHASGFLESPRLESLGHYVGWWWSSALRTSWSSPGSWLCFCTIPGNQIRRSSCTDQAWQWLTSSSSSAASINSNKGTISHWKLCLLLSHPNTTCCSWLKPKVQVVRPISGHWHWRSQSATIWRPRSGDWRWATSCLLALIWSSSCFGHWRKIASCKRGSALGGPSARWWDTAAWIHQGARSYVDLCGHAAVPTHSWSAWSTSWPRPRKVTNQLTDQAFSLAHQLLDLRRQAHQDHLDLLRSLKMTEWIFNRQIWGRAMMICKSWSRHQFLLQHHRSQECQVKPHLFQLPNINQFKLTMMLWTLNLAMHINQRNQPTGALNRAMLTPDRLDGHGNAPSRAPQHETIHPYFVDEDP